MHLLKSLLKFSIGILSRVNPNVLNNGRTLRVLEPYVLKSFDSGLVVSVISGIKNRAKDQQNRVMIRAEVGQVVIGDSRESGEPRRAGTKSVKPFFDVVFILLVISPSEHVTMVTQVLQITIIESVLKKVSVRVVYVSAS
jgi:hypothetical protein